METLFDWQLDRYFLLFGKAFYIFFILYGILRFTGRDAILATGGYILGTLFIEMTIIGIIMFKRNGKRRRVVS